MRLAGLCWLLVGCGAVHLGEEQRSLPVSGSGTDGAQAGAGATGDAASAGVGSGAPDAGVPPEVVVRVRPLDCGTCFELQAEAAGGQPPYQFEWQDGSPDAQRDVCVQDTAVELSVVASDADDLRSAPQSIRLENSGDAGCPEPVAPPDAAAPALCVTNPSFEGTPAPDFGVDPAFDAEPWSTCTNPVRANMPRIGNDTASLTGGVPPPRDGVTYMALGEGDQVSQELCSELQSGLPVHFEIDLSRVDLSGGTVPQTEVVFLEIFGGLSVDCSQYERLWASTALGNGWQRFCVTLRPSSFTTQLTLRGSSDMTSPSPAYVLVDNLQPVDSCP